MHFEIQPSKPPLRARRTAGERLRETLLALAQGRATLIAHGETSWASVTFAGTRHRFELAFEGAGGVEAGELFIALLPEHEFVIPGQLVADAAITAVDHRLEPPRMQVNCELLLLEEV